MSLKYTFFRKSPVAAAVAVALGSTAFIGFVTPAHAQEGGEALEEVRVTGSRILRRDLDATSPLVTIGSEAFEGQGTVALETSLNKMPQFVPAVTQFVTTDVQNTATNTVGASTVNLRGLGANRTLVLLDGRRAMPVNASLVVDINTIPSAAIKRVEVITGGASSAYGADAVGGVVNFILKNDFEGMEFDGQYGITEFGDDQELRVSALMGGNFSDNRGNAMFGVEYFKRGDARQDERDFYTKGWADPSVSGTEFFMSDTYWSPTPGNLPDQVAVNNLFAAAGPFVQATGRGVANSSPFFFNKDGSIYTGGQILGAVDVDGAYRYNGVLDGRFRALRQDGAIKENQQESLVSIPAERYSLFGRADYDVADNLAFFIQGNFSKTSTQSTLQFSPSTGGWAISIPFDAAHPVPEEFRQLLMSRPNNTAPWTLNRALDFVGPRGSSNDNTTYQVLAGFNGNLPFGDWTWEAYVSHGNTEVTNTLSGFASRERVRALLQMPNYGAGAVITGNQTPPGNGFAAATITCTSGLPIFGDFVVSQDCIDAISANMQNVTNMDQNIGEVNFQGALFSLPAGEVRGAVGADWRENTFKFQVDPLNANGSFLDGPVGIFPTASTFGSTEVKEGYAELLVPVLADLPAVKRLNLELGYRFSDYDTAGSVDTYKALADWTIIDSLRFRGGFQHANRAPNIGELFLPITTAVQGTAFGDPCGTNSTAPWGAGSANPNAAAARALCTQLMNKASATAAGVFYAQPQTGPAATIVTANTKGNLALKSEVADTLTAGFVWRPSFSNPLWSRLTASIDWYKIEIDDAIAPSTFDVIYNQCLNLASNPTQDINNPFCQLITREPTTGGVATVTGSFVNIGKIETSGVDLNVDWKADLADMGMSVPGAINVGLATTYLDSYKTQDLPTAPIVDYAGSMGPGSGLATATSNSGQYRYKTFTTLGYSVSGVAVNLRWRHLPSADAAAKPANPASPLVGPDAYDIFDLSGNWELSQTYSVRFGIENLFDTDPEIISSNPTPGPTFTTGQGTTNTGYYDVLGRRYFVGFKARF